MPRYCTPEVTFSYRVDAQTGCWVWTGCTTAGGYGQARVMGRPVYAHRFSYEQVIGPIPPGWQIHHHCRNRQCICPEHLECLPPSVHRLRHAHLTNDEVAAIRDSAALGMHPREIAARFGISREYTCRLVLNRGRTIDADPIAAPKAVRIVAIVPPEVQERIIHLHEIGVSQRRIAAILDVSRVRVRKILIAHNLAA